MMVSVCLQKFDEAAKSVKNLTKRPSDNELLELYALFKQATAGDNNAGK
jgi:acyl-CoA-binding protein